MKCIKKWLILTAVCSLFVFSSLSLASNIALIPQQNGKENFSFLFIQTAEVGRLHYKGQEGLYEIRLRKVDPWTIYFSDASKRITGFTSTKDFLTSYHNEITLKHKSGLNAALITLESDTQKNINLTFTIEEITYDEGKQRLIYKVRLLPGKQEVPLTHDVIIEKVVLLIDPCADCGGKGW